MSTSRTATPVLAEGPSNDLERVETGNQVVLADQPELSTPATAEQPPQNSSGEPEPLNGVHPESFSANPEIGLPFFIAPFSDSFIKKV